jgi:hypothetical protein
MAAYFPDHPYRHRQDDPDVGSPRPMSQGDVFLDVPLAGPATPHPKHADQWQPQVRTGPKALGMIVTHSCAARSQVTHRLSPVLSVAPVVKCPAGFDPPWEGYFELFPLPALRGGQDYVAKLNEVCPVPSDALAGRRIACLTEEGMEALFHRLAVNAIRFPEVPAHFGIEARRITFEMDLWELWAQRAETEDGFQGWLDEPFGGQLSEDSDGHVLEGSSVPSGQSRRELLVWNFDEVREELLAAVE